MNKSMNLDWLKDKIDEGFSRIAVESDLSNEDRIIDEIYRDIRKRLVVEMNDALNRIRKKSIDAIEREREIVS